MCLKRTTQPREKDSSRTGFGGKPNDSSRREFSAGIFRLGSRDRFTQRFVLPPPAENPPKHSALFLYGGKKARQCLCQREFQSHVGVSHVKALALAGTLLHVQWFPRLAQELEGKLTASFEVLRTIIMTIPDVDLGDSENVAVSFEEMKQKLSLSETVVKEGVFACLVISNIYHFLRMCEIWDPCLFSLPEAVWRESSLAPWFEKMEGNAMLLSLVFFGTMAQKLSLDEAFCSRLPHFADFFILSLFSSDLLQQTEHVNDLVQSVVFVLSFLLTTTRSLSSFFDSGSCMRVGVCLSLHVVCGDV